VEKSSKTVIYGLIAVSIFLLVLACINYINLTTAQIPQRSKEIGIRKTLGGSKRILILQMMIETAIIIGISILASYFVSKLGFYFLGWNLHFRNIIIHFDPCRSISFLVNFKSKCH